MEEELRHLNLEKFKKIDSKKLEEIISRLNQEEEEEEEEEKEQPQEYRTPLNTPFQEFSLISDEEFEERSPPLPAPQTEEMMSSIDIATTTDYFNTATWTTTSPVNQPFPIPHVVTKPVSPPPPPPTPSPTKKRKISQGIGRCKGMGEYKNSFDKQEKEKEKDEEKESTSSSENEANEEEDDIVKPKYRVKIEYWKKNRQPGCYEKHSNKTISYLSNSRENIRVFNKKQFDNLCLIHNERKLYLNYLDTKQEELLMQIKKQNKTKEKKLQK